MPGEVVTKLEVAADGALRDLDRFEKGMLDAGKATDYTSGAVAEFEARLAKARKAIQLGNAVTTESVARKSSEQRAWEKWAGTVDRTQALRIRLEREAQQAAVAAANAVNLGYTTQEQALNTLMALERRHSSQIAQQIAAERQMAVAINGTAAAANNAASSLGRLNAANDNRAGNHFNTANVTAQFQDIAVTAAMGMNPLQIALQQGTQLSAALGGQGLTGIVRTLGAAFMSLVSPLSLITIGAVALGAAAIQAFMSMVNGSESAEDALAKQKEKLDELLSGYKRAKEARDGYLEKASVTPAGSVASEIGAFQSSALKAYEKQLQAVRDEQQRWKDELDLIGQADGPAELTALMQNVLDVVEKAGLSTKTTTEQFNQLDTALTQIKNSGVDADIAYIAESLLDVVRQARDGKAMVESLGVALDNLPRDVQIRLAISQEYGSAMSEMSSLFMDPRSRFDVARESLKNWADQASATAQTYGELVGVGERYKEVLDSINAAESKAGAKSAAKPGNQWKEAGEAFNRRIEGQQLEIELMGKSTYEVERQRAAFDLLNEAKQAGIPITSKVIDQVNAAADNYATVTVELERLQRQQRQIDEGNGVLASSFSSLFVGVLRGTKSVQEGISDLIGSLGQLFLNRAFQMMFSPASSGGLGWGFGGGGLFGGSIIPGILHSGGTAGADGYGHNRAFSPSIWANAPRYHTGGIAGLQPNEVPAILQRGERVTPANQDQGNDNWPLVQVIDQRTGGQTIKAERATGPNGEKMVRLIVRDEVQQARRRGAPGF